jgi:hypothetical protein
MISSVKSLSSDLCLQRVAELVLILLLKFLVSSSDFDVEVEISGFNFQV